MKTRLAIVENQSAIREALHTYLCAQPEFDCMAVVGSVEGLLELLAAGALFPRLVLSDIGLPGAAGLNGIGLLRALVPAAEVVLITVYPDAERTFQAICAGAVGYLLKTTPLPEIKQALLDVLVGGSPMSPAIARHTARYFRPATGAALLLPHEQQLIEELEQGLSYKLVAARLGISLSTVHAGIRAVYNKLYFNSNAELLSRSIHG